LLAGAVNPRSSPAWLCLVALSRPFSACLLGPATPSNSPFFPQSLCIIQTAKSRPNRFWWYNRLRQNPSRTEDPFKKASELYRSQVFGPSARCLSHGVFSCLLFVLRFSPAFSAPLKSLQATKNRSFPIFKNPGSIGHNRDCAHAQTAFFQGFVGRWILLSHRVFLPFLGSGRFSTAPYKQIAPFCQSPPSSGTLGS